MKRSKWAIALLVLVLALGLVAFFAGACEEEPEQITGPVELKFSTSVGTKYSAWGAYLLPWYQAVEESSNGLVTITAYPDNTLVKEEQQYDALLDGTSDISVIVTDYNPGTFPIAEGAGLPLLFPSAGVASDVFYDMVQEYCQEEFKEVKVLGVVVISAAHYAGTKPVKVPDDFVGLRVRTGAALETDIINALGATPVEIATADLATSMERGMADGGFLSYSFMFVTGAPDWATDFTECELFYRCWVLAMNKDKWDSLSPEHQQAFLDNSGKEKSLEYNLANDALAAGPRKSIMDLGEEPGKSFYTLTEEDRALWKAAMEPVYQKWADDLPDGVDGQAILDKIDEWVAASEAAQPTTETTAAGIHLVFTDKGNDTVEIMIEPMPGQLFNVSTEGPFAAGIEAFDADGNSLGALELPDAANGVLDYSGVEGIAKIVVTDKAHGNVEYEYMIP